MMWRDGNETHIFLSREHADPMTYYKIFAAGGLISKKKNEKEEKKKEIVMREKAREIRRRHQRALME